MNSPARILTANEPWVEYQLDDGTLLRFRFTACQFRLTGGKTAQGDPEYSFSQSLLCETHAPKVVAEVRQLRAVPLVEVEPLASEPEQRVYVEPDADGIVARGAKYVAPDSDCG